MDGKLVPIRRRHDGRKGHKGRSKESWVDRGRQPRHISWPGVQRDADMAVRPVTVGCGPTYWNDIDVVTTEQVSSPNYATYTLPWPHDSAITFTWNPLLFDLSKLNGPSGANTVLNALITSAGHHGGCSASPFCSDSRSYLSHCAIGLRVYMKGNEREICIVSSSSWVTWMTRVFRWSPSLLPLNFCSNPLVPMGSHTISTQAKQKIICQKARGLCTGVSSRLKPSILPFTQPQP